MSPSSLPLGADLWASGESGKKYPVWQGLWTSAPHVCMSWQRRTGQTGFEGSQGFLLPSFTEPDQVPTLPSPGRTSLASFNQSPTQFPYFPREGSGIP